jgi:para-nitrobenzyl esterase
VVVVSVNHRLNILGYCDLSPFGEEYENSGNAGTDDLIAALKWIRSNIESFGGDPENVTVFGQSGGGAKVTTLLQSPEADGLFAKGINISGVVGATLKDGTGSGEALGKALMKETGVTTAAELEKVPYDVLAAAYNKVKPVLEKAGEYVGGTPFVNRHYAGDPVVNDFRKETAHIPLLVGSVFGEFGSFAPTPYRRDKLTGQEGEAIVEQNLGQAAAAELIPLFKEAYPERNPVDILTLDFMFRGPEIAYLKKRSACNDKTWAYFFNLDMPLDGGRTPWHCADIPYFFHNTNMIPYTQEKGVTERVEKMMFDSEMSFARTGIPQNDAVPEWPACTPEKEYTLLFGKDPCVRENFDHKLIPVLEKHMKAAFEKKMQNTNVQH